MLDHRIGPRRWLSFICGILPLVLAPLLLSWAVRQSTAVPVPPEAAEAPKSITNSIGLKLVMIPSGEFQMGTAEKEETGFLHEKPQHSVRISKPFYMGIYEVTQGQFAKLMKENPSRYKTGPDYPVEQVTWEEAVEFCKRLSELAAEKEAKRVYRLPTEAEWEYACRGGSTTQFHCGDALTAKQANFDREVGKPAKVGSYAPNAFGLYDMHGNVWEWCADWFDSGYYTSDAQDDPSGAESAGSRVIRGGGWYSEADRCRAAARDSFTPTHRFNDIGFRVVCTFRTP
jgi:formylglycine-generating enzyme required for sulfatase activity